MAKLRKLNSKNPKYRDKSLLKEKKIIKEVLLCNAPIRNMNKQIIPNKTVTIKGIWYE